jgi:hypothetical protein
MRTSFEIAFAAILWNRFDLFPCSNTNGTNRTFVCFNSTGISGMIPFQSLWSVLWVTVRAASSRFVPVGLSACARLSLFLSRLCSFGLLSESTISYQKTTDRKLVLHLSSLRRQPELLQKVGFGPLFHLSCIFWSKFMVVPREPLFSCKIRVHWWFRLCKFHRRLRESLSFLFISQLFTYFRAIFG